MLRCVIIDDELKSRESLGILIRDFCDDAEVVCTCASVDQGMKAIRKFQPDVVFLDVQMRRETGFDLLRKMHPVTFDVVFTTAYSEYAIKAFKFSAVDYLLKPIDIEELKESLRRVREKHVDPMMGRLERLLENLSVPDAAAFRLALPTQDGLEFFRSEDILYLEASGNYTNIYARGGKKYVVSRTLGAYEDILAERNFYRIHHAFLINMGAVQKYVRGEGGQVVMENGAVLDVSRRKKEGFLSRFRV